MRRMEFVCVCNLVDAREDPWSPSRTEEGSFVGVVYLFFLASRSWKFYQSLPL